MDSLGLIWNQFHRYGWHLKIMGWVSDALGFPKILNEIVEDK
jgi:hypothetical protein